MAIVKTPSYIIEPGGRMGDLVFYSFRGRVYARVYTKPVNPDTEKQRIVRSTFGSAVKSWQNLDSDEKNRYNIKGNRLSLSGYNFYISRYMKENLSYTDVKIESPGMDSGSANAVSLYPLQCPSVISPLSFAKGLSSPYKRIIQRPDML